MKHGKLAIGSLVLALLILISSLTKTPLLWGVNNLGYLPWGYILSALLLSGLIILVLYKLALLSPAQGIATKRPGSRQKILLITLLGLLFVILLYQFRSASYLWGDGFLRAQETSRFMVFQFTEPLDKLVQYLVFVVIGQNFNLNALQTHRLVSIGGGIFYFIIAIWFIKNFAINRLQKIFTGAIIFGSGLIQLFFGYIESYSLSTPLFLLALAVTYLRLKEEQSILPGIILYFISCLFHMSLLAYFPAFILIALILNKKHRRKFDRINLMAAILIPIVSGIIVYIINIFQFEEGFQKNLLTYLLIPLLPNSNGYWIFSPRHILDGFNLLLLTAPMAVIIFVVGDPLKHLDRKKLPVLFLISASACSILFLLLFHTAFGIGRDWDLFSSCALPLNLLALLIMFSKFPGKPNKSIWKIILPLYPALLITISFILMNSRIESTVEKFRDVIDYTNYGKNMSLETLSIYYEDIIDSTMYFAALREAAEIEPNARYYYKMGSQYMSYNKFNEAIDCFQKSLEIDMTYTNSLNYLATIYGGLADSNPDFFDLSEKYFGAALELEPENVNSLFNLGVVQLKQHKHLEARESFKQAIKYSEDFIDPYAGLAESYMKTHEYAMAERYYKIVLSMEPDRFKENYLLIKVYMESNQISKALDQIDSLYEATDSLNKKIGLIKTYAELGEYKTAIQKLEALCSDTTCPLEAYVTMANLYQIEKKINRALSTLSIAAEYYNDEESLVSLAEAFMHLNYRDSSELYFLKAVKTNPQYAVAYQKLSLFYILSRTPHKARFVLENGLKRITDSASVAEFKSILEKLDAE